MAVVLVAKVAVKSSIGTSHSVSWMVAIVGRVSGGGSCLLAAEREPIVGPVIPEFAMTQFAKPDSDSICAAAEARESLDRMSTVMGTMLPAGWRDA